MESFADESLEATTVAPIAPAAARAEGRLLVIARENDRISVADKLPYLFDNATCPRCHAPFELRRALY